VKKAKDYIIFPLDVATREEAGHYIRLLSNEVGMFKVGLELFITCGPGIVHDIHAAGEARVFLDLKLHDIPETVKRAARSVGELGVHFATVHCGESVRMLEAAVEGSAGKTGILGVTVLTSVGASDIRTAGFRDEFADNVTDLVAKRAEQAKKAGCVGVVSSGLEVPMIKSLCGPEFVSVTPGIRPAWEDLKKDDQTRVATPARAVQNGSDYLVIGRPIRDAKDPVAAARMIADEIRSVTGKP
jgi:orotidine-5'-phosphate decarboxylase